MRIVFVGDDWVGSNARSLADGFQQAGHEVVVVDTTAVTLPDRLSPSWAYSKVRGRRHPGSVDRVHRDVERAVTHLRPDVLFCFKSIHLDQDRLLTTDVPLHVHYSPDDVSNPENLTQAYLDHEHRWDLVVTTKRHNVDELRARGARAIQFVWSAYDPAWHHPSARRTTDRFAVGFIGVARADRMTTMTALAREYGTRFALWGPLWGRYPALRASGVHIGGPVYGEQFSVAVSATTANLVLLNSDNRDTHTCRSLEIPGAGGLFVGERTDEHRELLAEERECLLFSSFDELSEQLRWIDRHPAEAAAIAGRGHRRIVEDRHRYVDRAEQIADAITAAQVES